jgi:hypothetical protein
MKLQNKKIEFMKNIVLLLLIIFGVFNSSYAQTTPRQPDGWKEFVAEDKSFVISLPEISKAQEDAISNAIGLFSNLPGAKVYKKVSFLGNVAYGISFQDFSAPLLDDLEKEAQYELLEEQIGVKTGNVYAQKYSEVDFQRNSDMKNVNTGNQKYSGIQSVIESDSFYIFSRSFIVEQRIFRLMTLVPKNELDSSRDNVLRFFTSFRVAQIPPAKNKATPLPPKDFKITATGRKFESEALKLTFQFPANWKTTFHQPDQQITPEKKREYEKERAGLRWLWRNREGFASSVSSTKSVMDLLINRQPAANSTLEDFVAERGKFQRASVSNTEINGIKFLVLSSEDNEKYYLTVWNEYFLEIYMKFESEEDLKLMEESLATLKKLN